MSYGAQADVGRRVTNGGQKSANGAIDQRLAKIASQRGVLGGDLFGAVHALIVVGRVSGRRGGGMRGAGFDFLRVSIPNVCRSLVGVGLRPDPPFFQRRVALGVFQKTQRVDLVNRVFGSDRSNLNP